MKIFLLILAGLSAFWLFSPHSAQAADAPNDEAKVLCLPGNYTFTATDCQPSGPSIYQAEMAKKGIVLPIPPIPRPSLILS